MRISGTLVNPMRLIVENSGLCLLSVLFGQLGFLGAIPPGNVTVVWPPSGIALATILSLSTHFNPVDLVCGVRNYQGRNFDLQAFSDKSTGFITIKSKDGRELKAMELPGLWNGAMAFWNTIFVEVPSITFNPVKTVNDLLRPEHQP